MNNRTAVLLSTYNGENYLSQLLESLLGQTCPDFDIFVRDDGSTDRTLDIIDQYTERLQLKVLNSSERLGAAKSFLQLLSEAGDDYNWYMFADQDDYWESKKITRVKTCCADYQDPILYFTRYELADHNLKHIGYSPVPKVISFQNALVENIVTGCTMALNNQGRKLALKSKPGDMIMHDWWFYIVFSAFGKIVFDDFVSLKYRQHDQNCIGVASSFLQGLMRRSRRFLSRKKTGVFCISDQASEFLSCYKNAVSDDQLQLLNSIEAAKSSYTKRLELMCNFPFIRQKKIDTTLLRFLILLGRF